MKVNKNKYLQKNVRAVLLYSKVVVGNWQAFVDLGVDYLYAPTAPYNIMRLNYPVSLGNYQTPQDPSQAMVIHMVKSMVIDDNAPDLRHAYRTARRILLDKSYKELETEVIEQINEFYALADATPDIRAITINRWAHGYSYERKYLWDDYDNIDEELTLATRPHGNIHIANADGTWNAYIQYAISEAIRAVNEL